MNLSRALTLGSGSGVNTTLDAAGIAAAAAGGTLTPGAIYFDTATGIHYLASSTSAYAPLSATAHLGTITVAAMLAQPSPLTGMTCDLSDLGNIISRWRYNGTRWAPLGGRQLAQSLLADTYEATADGTERLVPNCQFAIPVGLMAYDGAGLEVYIGAEKSAGSADATMLQARMGSSAGTADAVMGGPYSFASQRTLGVILPIYRVGPTSVRLRGAGNVNSTSARFGNLQNTVRSAAATVGNMDAGGSVNYLSLMTQRAGAFAEYIAVNTFDVWVTGR